MPVSVAQVLAQDGSVAGVGFLVSGGAVITCAHVVHAAGQGPGGRVELSFPHLPDAPRARGGVVAGRWRAPEAEDIAVVQLESVPAGARELLLGAGAGCRGHRVSSFGFPVQAPEGGHFGYGRAGDLLRGDHEAGMLLQLSEANDLTTGFSGGPVVDEVTGLVIGMVTSIVSPDTHLKGLGIAYATPTEVLREALPELTEHQVCPYRGLEPFTADHSRWFHGRDAAVESVLATLGGQRRMLLLLGPSGAGKSSLVQAGVLPALAEGAVPGSDRWLPLLLRPGQDLPTALEGAGLTGASTEGILPAVERRLTAEPDCDRLLLVIDQFEELLTQPTTAADAPVAEPAVAAAEELVAVLDAHAALSVILIMRDDFYPRLASMAPQLLETAAPGLLNVPATLSVPELRAIITQPAQTVGVRFEDGLPERIITDVLAAGPARQASVTLLPPLELALSQLWERRQDGRLTHQAYQQIGEVTGSLTTWCNSALNQLPAAHRPTAKRILTALVRPGDEAHAIPATRHQIPLTRLRTLATDTQDAGTSADTDFDDVLAALTRHRIITTGTTTQPGDAPGEPMAELIHDALIRDWDDLRDWAAQDHRFQVWLHRAAEAQARHAVSIHPGDLLDGTVLAEGIDWSRQRSLPPDITAFLTTSRQHQQATVRRTRRINTVLAGMLALALIATGVTFWQRQTALTAQDTAVAAQHEAQSRQLAAQSSNVLDSDPDLASLLAVQAYRTSPSDDAAASLYTAAAIPLRHRLTGHTGPVRSVAFSPDGKSLATSGADRITRLWDVATGKTRATLHGPAETVTSVAFSPDGKTLATSSYGILDKIVRLWDVKTGKALSTLHPQIEATSVAFSPDGKTLATGSDGSTVRLWDVKTGKTRTTLHGPYGEVNSVAFSPDGKTLATSSDNHTVRLWDVHTGKTRTTLHEPIGQVNSVAFSPDGKTLATGSDGSTVRLWDVSTGKILSTLHGHTDEVASAAFSPDSKTLATGSLDHTVRLWDVSTGKTLSTLHGHTDEVASAAFSPDSKTLATGSLDHTTRLWDVHSGQTRTTLQPKILVEVASLAFSPDGKTLATSSLGRTVRLWDVATGKTRTTLHGRTEGVNVVAFSLDGKTLATSNDDHTVRLWDVNTGKTRTTLHGHTERVTSVAFSPDSKTLATSSTGETVRLWDVQTGTTRTTFHAPLGGGNSVVFSPDGKTLASDWSNNNVRLWDVNSGKTRALFRGHTGGVKSVAFSPDGKTLATGAYDRTVRLWDVNSGKARTTLRGHTYQVTSVAFSPDSKTLATSSEDRTVRLWDVATGKTRTTLHGPIDTVSSVAFSPNGKTLATSSTDVRLWDVSLPDPAGASKQICKALHRDFTKEERSLYLQGQASQPVCPVSSTR
ncbi:nSTAND1 domain-containing NTPase [Streptomyces decoyicus]|uniref:nSTAND1 domain-containing NTPase n=1 Tax=Streptomyces decoyicus TaxID=249567 RepID=UPI0036544F87